MKKQICLAGLLSLSVLLSASAQESCLFKTQIGAAGFKNAGWGISVRDSATGKQLVACDPEKNLVPASILKLFVTAAALEILGPDKRFKTRLYLDGNIVDGVLKGALYIRGGGDPTFGSTLIKDAPVMDTEFAKWTLALKQAGVREIDGKIISDSSLFQGIALPGSWSWEDIGNYYAAQPTALAMNDNLYVIYFAPGARPGTAAKVLRFKPELPELRLENQVTTGAPGSGDNTYIYNFPEQYSGFIAGTVPQGPAEFAVKGALPDPALFVAQKFTQYLGSYGIKVSGAPEKITRAMDYGTAKFLAESEGATVKDIVYYTNKRSFNFYAEMFLRHIAIARGKAATIDGGLEVLRAYLIENGVNVSELKLSDASGLSRQNLVSAGEFSGFLARMTRKQFFGSFLASLVSPGDIDASGHVKKLGAGTKLEKRLRVKSGSLAGVRAYSGYLTTEKGRILSFTSILNNYAAEPSEIDKVHEAMFLELQKKY